MPRTLSYKKGWFYLDGTTAREISDLAHNIEWAEDDTGQFQYITESFLEANKFKDIADHAALTVLNKAFVKKFSLLDVRALPPFLDAHQREGIEWILSRSRSYLAHAPGAGKTAQAFLAAVLSGTWGQVVIVVPPSFSVNWEREMNKFWSMLGRTDWLSVAVIPGSASMDYSGWASEYLIVPDSMLAKPWVYERLAQIPKRMVIVDEASRFKDPTAQRSIALFGGKLKDGSITKGLIAGAERAVLLDGSPMPNRPMELWGPTYAMCPEAIDFMSQQEFGFKYCGAAQDAYGRWEFKHSRNEAELRVALKKDFMHVVTEASLNHPERQRSLLYMSEDARSPAHKRWEAAHLANVKLEDIGEHTSQGKLAEYRHELGLRKTKWVADYVASRLEDKNESILLFCWHRVVLLDLERRLAAFKPSVIMGGVDEYTREAAFSTFQAGKKKLLILNIAAGGRGHNLQRADRVIFCEWSWCNETNLQCEKRASRKGSDKLSVRVDYIVSPNSMDEIVLQAVFKKEERVKKVIG